VHGVLNVESGYYVEETEVEEPIPESPSAEKKEGDAMDVDKDAAKEPPKMRKVKKQQRKGDLPLSAGTASLDEESKQTLAEKENSMIMEDKLVADTENEKNNLESFIYELKDKILDVYAEFASDDEKARLNTKLETIEEWLYDEGDDASKAQYVSKKEDIRSIAGPIIQRYNDKIESERQAVMEKQQKEHAAKQAELERAKREAEAKKQAEAPPAEEPKDAEMTDAEAQKPDGVEEAS
jgi:heat shock protein 4